METLKYLKQKIAMFKSQIQDTDLKIKWRNEEISKLQPGDDELLQCQLAVQGLEILKEILKEKLIIHGKIFKELQAFEAVKRNIEFLDKGQIMAFCLYEGCNKQTKDFKTIKKGLKVKNGRS